MAEVARCCRKTEVIDSMNRQDLSLGPVEMTGAFTKRKEKRVNANTYQEGWIEWKTKSKGRRACRFRYWEPDDSKPNGRRKAAGPWKDGLTTKQARKELREFIAGIEATRPRTPVIPKAKDLTLSGFVESYWKTYQQNRGLKQSTRDSHAANLKNHVIPVFGTIPMKAISSSDISNFFSGLESKKLCSKSVLNVYQLLHVMFEVAAEHDLIDHNPVRKKLHRPRHTHKKMPIWSAENVQKILLEIPLRWRVVFWCIALTGVRVGGTAGVTVERYRLEREDDHIFSWVLEGSATGIHEDRPGTRQAHAPKFRARFCGPPTEFDKHRTQRFCFLPFG
jgi:Phage integrase, N-terminal SAM-like domain